MALLVLQPLKESQMISYYLYPPSGLSRLGKMQWDQADQEYLCETIHCWNYFMDYIQDP